MAHRARSGLLRELPYAIAALKQPPHRDHLTVGLEPGTGTSIEVAIRFLNADLFRFRSGYVKKRLLRRLARRLLRDDGKRRLRTVVLAALHRPARREDRAVRGLAARIGNEFLARKTELARSDDAGLACRAG